MGQVTTNKKPSHNMSSQLNIERLAREFGMTPDELINGRHRPPNPHYLHHRRDVLAGLIYYLWNNLTYRDMTDVFKQYRINQTTTENALKWYRQRTREGNEAAESIFNTINRIMQGEPTLREVEE